MQQHSTRVSHPFDVVKERFHQLSEEWLEDAARASLDEAQTSGRAGRATPAAPLASQVRLRAHGAFVGRTVYALPLELTVAGPNGNRTLKGSLEMSRIDAAQTNIGLMLASEPPAGDGAFVHSVMASFLARISLAVRGYTGNGTGTPPNPDGRNNSVAAKPPRPR